MRAVTGVMCAMWLALGCSNPLYSDKSHDVAVESVKVTPQTVQLFAVGETQNLSATIVPLDATDRAVTWESTNPAVASVDANGRVTARSVGFGVFITVITHDGHHEASATVSVNP
ncbi:MAG: Ig-like domain-containing protein [Gemmatimonadaceae bacterium]